MLSPKSLPDDWQQALVKAQNEALYVREGLTAKEFAELANVHPNTVGKYARRGIERFQAKFGPNCTFEKVNRPGSSQMQWRLTFVGPLKESPEKPPVPGALRAQEFATRQDVSLGSLYLYHLKGHTWFRQRFPGWDFLEVPLGTKCMLRWYVPVDKIMPQSDLPPEDHLTEKQFGILQGVGKCNLVAVCRRNGVQYFEARFPGWSFREETGRLVFFRHGVERPQFSAGAFAMHIGQPHNYVLKQINENCFEQAFPGWEVRSFRTVGSRFRTHMISPVMCALPEVSDALQPLPEITSDRSEEPSSQKSNSSGSHKPGFDAWQLALVHSHCETIHTFSGLGTPDFCELTGCSSGIVLGVVKKGIEHFQARFGAGCSFKKVASTKRPYKYEFTLVGRVYPTALKIPGIRLLTIKDFAYEQEWAEADIWKVMEFGHPAVRSNFPNWDYWEVAHPYKDEMVQLFMPILNISAESV